MSRLHTRLLIAAVALLGLNSLLLTVIVMNQPFIHGRKYELVERIVTLRTLRDALKKDLDALRGKEDDEISAKALAQFQTELKEVNEMIAATRFEMVR
jgi:hypothetical protein